MPQVDKPHERKTEAMDERHIIHQKDDPKPCRSSEKRKETPWMQRGKCRGR